MKYVKTFEGIKQTKKKEFPKTKAWVINKLTELGLNDIYYKINDDLSVDYKTFGIRITGLGLEKIPIKFNKVEESFQCSDNKLKSLENAPNEVGGGFSCSRNKLISLDGCPQKVTDFYCEHNNLKSLKGCPSIITEDVDVSYNKLTSLKELPDTIESLDCRYNDIKDPKELIRFAYLFEGSNIQWIDNPIYDLVQKINEYLVKSQEEDIEYSEILERLDEFEVIKDDKLDLIRLSSLLQFYDNTMGDEEEFKNLGYETIG